MRVGLVLLAALSLTLGASRTTRAAEYFVDAAAGSDGNPGTAQSPFATIGRGLNEAQPGDVVTVRPGMYAETVATVRHGMAGAPVTVRAAQPRTALVQASGNVLRISHGYHTIEGLVIDGLLGPGRPVEIDTPAAGLVLRNVEVKNGGNNCIDMDSPDGVLIEQATIHHCLRWDGSLSPPGPVDAHGITGTGPTRLTIRDTEIYYVSGDAIQISPPRAFWDEVLVERTTMWTGALPAAAGMFPAGTVVGENAFDSKTPASGPRSRITFRDVLAHGFSGFITNQGAFNLKENVEALVDGVTVHGSEIAFRVRAPALVTVKNAVIYGNQKSVRYEDGISGLRIVNTTFADAVAFENGGGGGLGAGFVLANGLFVGAPPAEAMGSTSNLSVMPSVFVNAAANDYHLLPSTEPVDKGEALADVTVDRDGVPRPVGPAYDVGAYEWTDQPVEMDGGMPTGSGTGASAGSATGAGAAGGSGGTGGTGAQQDSGEQGGCGCRLAGARELPAGMHYWGFILAVAGFTICRRARRGSSRPCPR